MDYPSLSTRERDRRYARLRALMAQGGLDALVIVGLKGREHFEGYVANEYIEGVAVLPLASDPVLLTWHPKMVIRRMGAKMDRSRFWIDDVRIGKYGPGVVAVLEERGLAGGRIGVVGLEVPEPGCPEGIVPYPMWRAVLEGLPQAEFRDVTWEFRELMIEKSAEEQAILRHAAAIGERAAAAMLEAVRPGASEHRIYDAIQSAIHGAGAVPHDPFLIMTWGRDDLGWFEPHWTYAGGSPRIVEPGDILMAELFPTYAGIETQQQVSIAVAPVEPVVAELAGIARRAYEAGLALLKPGVTFEALWQAMLRPVEEAGCWTLTPMVHSLPLGWTGGMGHAIERMPEALRRWSMTGVIGRRPLVVRAGMSFALEPNACRGQRRMNLGGSVLVGADGAEELNRLPNRMHVIG
jgi:Xaa-Pro aminopeptidase